MSQRFRIISFLALCAIALSATTAIAQVDPAADGIGIYADLGGTTSQVQAPAGTPFEAYVLLTRPSRTNGITAWECGIQVPDNMTIWGWNIQGDFMNFGAGTTFAVCYNEPRPATDVVHLMTFIVVPQNGAPGYFYLDAGTYDSGNDGVPNYIDDANWDILVPLHTWPNGVAQPAFAVNSDQQLPADDVSWGEVKALFR